MGKIGKKFTAAAVWAVFIGLVIIGDSMAVETGYDKFGDSLTIHISSVAQGEYAGDPNRGRHTGATGDFAVEVFSIASRFSLDDTWWIEPNALTEYSNRDREGHTDSTVTRVPAPPLEQGRFKAGSEFGHTFTVNSANIHQVGIEGLTALVWDFISERDVTIGSITASSPDLGAAFGAGLSIMFIGGVSASLSVNYQGIDSEFDDAVTGNINLSIPLN